MLIEKRIPLVYSFIYVWREIILVVLFATVSYILSEYFDLPVIPVAIGTFLGTAISLILAFKLSQSYDRWWEARKIWGSIVNDSRTLITQANNFTRGYDGDEIKRMAYRQIGWCYSLGRSLRGLNPVESLDQYIDQDEMLQTVNQDNVPMTLLDLHTAQIAEMHAHGLINDFQQIQLDSTIVRLCASMGMAERIKNTVFPTTYRLYLRFSIFVFLGLVSLSIAEISEVWQIVLLVLLSIPFFLLEKTAYLLQDPFENRPTDTPVTSIARTIEINLLQLTGHAQVPAKVEASKYYIM